MACEIPKGYQPQEIEPKWADYWVAEALFRADPDAPPPIFSVVIPPPNITGSLHVGHMLEHTEIDILMRWHRMKGENLLWLPGTDHASIATQLIVERELGREAVVPLWARTGVTVLPDDAQKAFQREGQRRRLEMGPERFIERCWQWKEANGGTIRKQMMRLGAS